MTVLYIIYNYFPSFLSMKFKHLIRICDVYFSYLFMSGKSFYSFVILLRINTNSSFCILLWVLILLNIANHKFKIILCILLFSIFMS